MDHIWLASWSILYLVCLRCKGCVFGHVDQGLPSLELQSDKRHQSLASPSAYRRTATTMHENPCKSIYRIYLVPSMLKCTRPKQESRSRAVEGKSAPGGRRSSAFLKLNGRGTCKNKAEKIWKNEECIGWNRTLRTMKTILQQQQPHAATGTSQNSWERRWKGKPSPGNGVNMSRCNSHK